MVLHLKNILSIHIILKFKVMEKKKKIVDIIIKAIIAILGTLFGTTL